MNNIRKKMYLSANYFDKAEFLKAMAHPARLRILRNLLETPLIVSQIQSILKISQSLVSQHLAVLRKAGIVVIKKKNTRIEYKIVDNKISIIRELIA